MAGYGLRLIRGWLLDMGRKPVKIPCSVFFAIALFAATSATAQLSGEDIAALQSQAKASGWTFEVGENVATRQPISKLCGLTPPDDWWVGARFNAFKQKADLPVSFDWRAHGGCTPVKNQGGCGSCWAFATVGTLECSIKIKDGQNVSLAEQWLVSCNQETETPHVLGGAWGCNGGWWAHDYHSGAKTDPCGGSGAVLSTSFPYMAYNLDCGCPYPHEYAMDSWAYIGEMEGIPETDAIKQAMLAYGPVTAAVYVSDAFSAYKNGVFNQSELQEVNHGIVLVGWDDAQGSAGVWILRNSWSGSWGEGGYMRIEYGCCNVGYGACYVDYAGKGKGIGPVIQAQPRDADVPQGWQHVFSVDVSGLGQVHYQWEHNGQPVGSDSPLLALDNLSAGDEGAYVCRVTDIRGESVSESVELSLDTSKSVPAPRPLRTAFLMTACAICLLRARSVKHS